MDRAMKKIKGLTLIFQFHNFRFALFRHGKVWKCCPVDRHPWKNYYIVFSSKGTKFFLAFPV